MKTFTIYAQNDNEPRYSLATITGDSAEKVVNMLFDYQEWEDHKIRFASIWAKEDSDE